MCFNITYRKNNVFEASTLYITIAVVNEENPQSKIREKAGEFLLEDNSIQLASNHYKFD